MLSYWGMDFWTRTFIPTLKESPADAEIRSHQYLLRAGLIRKTGSGLYSFLPLGLRSLRKIEAICREELHRAGAVELQMTAIHPAEIWQRGPRWQAAREVMYRVDSAGQGQTGAEDPQYVLGPTHEEIITTLAAAEIDSYRDLPKNFYQIQTKFRNEIRPRFGLMRAKEFLMKDGYSFDVSDEAAIETYGKMRTAYEAFFSRLGVEFVVVEADTGVMGGSYSHEFMVPAEVGDDDILFCLESGYASNREKARSRLIPDELVDPEPEGALEDFATPEVKTIADLTREPFSVPAEKQFKTLLYIGDDQPFVIVLRGQDDLEEAKLNSLGFQLIRPATEEEIKKIFGASPGSLGALKGRLPGRKKLAGIFADEAIHLIGNGVTGANKDGFHTRKVNVQRDLDIDRFGDFRQVQPGEPCPLSGKPLQMRRAIEVGHIFKLGTKYSEAFEARFNDEKGQTKPLVMGCYGIGVSRTLQAVIEQKSDDKGIVWPFAVAPYQVLITLLDPDQEEASKVATTLAEAAESVGADVLIDDRKERPGVKFNDADLIGIPLRIVVGARGLKSGELEARIRATGENRSLPLAEAPASLCQLLAELRS
ncbi:MAG: proline--tRNA ligase [Opitutales bacterium]|nr:proline--tRNA ligase [Opitutales bacterium]